MLLRCYLDATKQLLTVPVRFPDVVAAHERLAIVRLALEPPEFRHIRPAFLQRQKNPIKMTRLFSSHSATGRQRASAGDI